MREQIIKELVSIKRKGINKLIKYLDKSDFFTAPCSIDHHLNIRGGLAQHSWNVYLLFKEKNTRYNLTMTEDTMKICGLMHDICKTEFYKLVIKENKEGIKDGSTIYGYEYDDKFPLGHGEKSVIILQRFISLTEEECCIIRWHMAGFDLSNYSKPAYYEALRKYPACLALHTADYEATTFLEDKHDTTIQN